MEVLNHGQIKRLQLPSQWGPAQDADEFMSQVRDRQFCPQGNPDIKIGMFYRGQPVNDTAGSAFIHTLAQGARELQPEQLDELQLVLGSLAHSDSFRIATARVRNLNGRAVLEVEGEWFAAGNSSVSVLLPSENSGRYIQEIYMVTPTGEFAKEREAFDLMLNSIEWV